MSKAFQPIRGLMLFVLLISTATLIFNLSRPNEIVGWRTDFAAVQDEADKSGKPFLAYFTASWCGPCQEMKHTAWADRRVKEALEPYRPVKVDVDERKDIAQQFRIEAMPTMMLIGPDGKVVRQTTGYMSADEFLKWLNEPPAVGK